MDNYYGNNAFAIQIFFKSRQITSEIVKVWPFSLFVEYGYNFNSDLSGLIRSTLGK